MRWGDALAEGYFEAKKTVPSPPTEDRKRLVGDVKPAQAEILRLTQLDERPLERLAEEPRLSVQTIRTGARPAPSPAAGPRPASTSPEPSAQAPEAQV